MLTAISMACMLWLPPVVSSPQAGCAPCGDAYGACMQGCGGKRNLCTAQGWRSLLFTDCVCPLGATVPDGIDFHAYMMSRRRPGAAPATTPAAGPAPASGPVQPAYPVGDPFVVPSPY